MTTNTNWVTAGLIFAEFRDLDIVEIANHVTGGFEALGHRVTGTHIISDMRALITTARFELHLSAEEDIRLTALQATVPSYLSVAIARSDPSRATAFSRDSVLARVLQILYGQLQPDHVKWIDTDVVLSSDEFARATGHGVEGGRATSRKSLPDIETTNAMLQQRLSDHDPRILRNLSSPDRPRKVLDADWVDPAEVAAAAAREAVAREQEDIEKTAPLRLSAWFLSFAVALFALPVGIMLVMLNLAKGENLRLASQTAALTGTFVALQAHGSTAHAMTTLQGLLG